jgi:REP element-mobilizing transposase RayT
MARPLRIEFPDAIYHIMARGNEKKVIFWDNNDYKKFLFYLGEGSKAYRFITFAYILMPNHYHLILQTKESNLSKAMHLLNTAYTVYLNKKYNRVGHLFQGRYKALLVQKNRYLLEVSRYVHLNALRAGVTRNLFAYPWSSFRYYVEQIAAPDWLDINVILNMLSKNAKECKRVYRKFMEDGISGTPNPFDEVYAQTILGDKDFIDSVLEKYDVARNHEMPATKQLASRSSFETILNILCQVLRKNKTQVRQGGRHSLERKILIYLLKTRTSMNLKEIGKRFGITYSAVSQIKRTVDERLQHDTKLEKIIEKVDVLLKS